ncbi:hypothetical protein P4C99_15070 [Pontiellaceae bacterium B1224]|nr:hypothetical protein [Pontiellaceae bacterium B1224]
MKKLVLILNWSVLAYIVVLIVMTIIGNITEISDEPILTMGGADGPTAVFISTRLSPYLTNAILVALLLLTNIYVLQKKEK